MCDYLVMENTGLCWCSMSHKVTECATVWMSALSLWYSCCHHVETYDQEAHKLPNLEIIFSSFKIGNENIYQNFCHTWQLFKRKCDLNTRHNTTLDALFFCLYQPSTNTTKKTHQPSHLVSQCPLDVTGICWHLKV